MHLPLVRVQLGPPADGVKLKLAVPVGCEAGKEVSVIVAVH